MDRRAGDSLDALAMLEAMPISDTQQRQAKRAVATHAYDAEDCLELLRALGLTDAGFRWTQSMSDHGTGKRRKIYTRELP